VACVGKDYDAARAWYGRHRVLCEKLDDGDSLMLAFAALGHTLVQAGDISRARVAWASGLQVADAVGDEKVRSTLRTAIEALDNPPTQLNVAAEFAGIRLHPPKPKLSTPFRVASLSGDVFPRRKRNTSNPPATPVISPSHRAL